MAHVIVDRRKNDKNKSSVNRQKYVRRVRESVREAVKEKIRDIDIEDIADEKSKKIKIRGGGLSKPTFQNNPRSGVKDHVLPGNKQYQTGDRIPKPESGQGEGGSGGSSDGEGEDDFSFHLTQQEFLDIFFEDLELPNVVKKDITKVDEWVSRRAGFSDDGPPNRMNIEQSMRQAKSRRIALRAPKRKKIKELQKQLDQLNAKSSLTADEQQQKEELEQQIETLKRKLKAVPFIDDVDLRYNQWKKVPLPSTQAVMFCLMDVSASMGDWEKEMAKRFFMLLYLFLKKDYEHVDIVFIRHTQFAKEVDQEEFFYSKETGGTVVSSSFQLMKEIVDERYPLAQWNVFACQASDGDDFPDDLPVAQQWLDKSILPIVQYFAYIQLSRDRGQSGDLWPYYEQIKDAHANFAMADITDVSDIYPVFHGLFKKT